MTTLKRKMKGAPAKPALPVRQKSEDMLPDGHDIALRAYDLFIQRGGVHGHDLEDWLVAERQLSQRG